MKKSIILRWYADEGRNGSEATITVDFADLLPADEKTPENLEAIEKHLAKFGQALKDEFDADGFETDKSLADLDKRIDEQMRTQ